MLRDADEGGDGSVVVFSDRGLRPCNWMPPGSVINETTEGFEIVHRQRGEYLRIAINTVLDESRVDPGGYS
jgi:RecB family endonuclease NucS